MPCTEAYKEHIMYTFNGFCKTVIRFAALERPAQLILKLLFHQDSSRKIVERVLAEMP